MKQQNSLRNKPLSLYPLKFDDAVTALLKTKPEPKAKKLTLRQQKNRPKTSKKKS